MGLRFKTAASSSPVALSIALYSPIVELVQHDSRLVIRAQYMSDYRMVVTIATGILRMNRSQ